MGGGALREAAEAKSRHRDCFWFCCVLQFTITRDGPKGHLLSLEQTPDVPVLVAFPAGSFLAIFAFLGFQMLAVSP